MYVPQPSRGFGATGSQDLTAVGATIMGAAFATGPAAPFVAIAGLMVEFLGQMGVGSGCGQSCVLSTQYANQAEALLQKNIAAYFAIAAPRPASVRTAALQNVDLIFNDLRAQCGNPALGDAGRNCISERLDASSCKWKQPAASVPPWGSPPAGACWNWVSGYRDPIANDPNVYDDSASAAVSTASDSVSSTLASGLSTPALIGLAVIAALGIWAVAS